MARPLTTHEFYQTLEEEEERRLLIHLLGERDIASILSIGDIYIILKEEFNNDILDLAVVDARRQGALIVDEDNDIEITGEDKNGDDGSVDTTFGICRTLEAAGKIAFDYEVSEEHTFVVDAKTVPLTWEEIEALVESAESEDE